MLQKLLVLPITVWSGVWTSGWRFEAEPTSPGPSHISPPHLAGCTFFKTKHQFHRCRKKNLAYGWPPQCIPGCFSATVEFTCDSKSTTGLEKEASPLLSKPELRKRDAHKVALDLCFRCRSSVHALHVSRWRPNIWNIPYPRHKLCSVSYKNLPLL